MTRIAYVAKTNKDDTLVLPDFDDVEETEDHLTTEAYSPILGFITISKSSLS